MILERFKPDIFILILTPLLIFLLFWNLGNQYLWYDEAQTAVLARSVLEYGYPRALIGDFLVYTDETYGPGTSYVAQPWLQNYVCAASFFLFGESNTSARVMFAIFGLLSFFLLYALSYRLFKSRLTARLTLAISATSVMFLLHLRQCRYYSLSVFLVLALLLLYLNFIERRKYSSGLFIVASFLLFHANFGAFIPVLAALALYFLFIEKRRDLIPEFIKLYLWVLILVLPWCIVYKIWAHGSEAPIGDLVKNAKFYLSKINAHFFPYRFLTPVILILFLFRKKFKSHTSSSRDLAVAERNKKGLIFLGLLIIVNWVFFWFADEKYARYIVHIAGLFFIIDAFLLTHVFKWNKIVGVLLLIMLCFSNLLHTSLFYIIAKPITPVISSVNKEAQKRGIIDEKVHGKIEKELHRVTAKAELKTYFFDFLYEITHDYDGPMEGVVAYLKEFATRKETIKTDNFNANSLFFYTDLKVDYDFSKETYPEWIFLRDFWTQRQFYDTPYFRRIEKLYEKIELEFPDIWWENRPDDMKFHHFKTAPLKKKISLYRQR